MSCEAGNTDWQSQCLIYFINFTFGSVCMLIQVRTWKASHSESVERIVVNINTARWNTIFLFLSWLFRAARNFYELILNNFWRKVFKISQKKSCKHFHKLQIVTNNVIMHIPYKIAPVLSVLASRLISIHI